MFLPLHDKNPLTFVAFQFVTVVLIILCTLVFWWQSGLEQQAGILAALGYGYVPALMFDGQSLPDQVSSLPSGLTLGSYIFMHASWMHLIGNMLFLWVFGDNVEDAMGHVRFLLFFLGCGVAAGLTHGLMEPYSVSPLVGASGAVAGVLGAYLMLHPRVKVLVLLFSRIPIHLPAHLLLLGWLIYQLAQVYWLGGPGNTAWWAHIGGFVVGALLVIPMRQPDVPLFDRGTPH